MITGVVKKNLGCDVLVPPLKHTHFSVYSFFHGPVKASSNKNKHKNKSLTLVPLRPLLYF